MIKKTMFGGVNIKPKVVCSFEDTIYYCSSSNILISDDIKVNEVVFLNGYLNFVNVLNKDVLISGDVDGYLYILKRSDKFDETFKNKGWDIISVLFSEMIQEACFIDSTSVVCLYLKSIVIYDINKKQNIFKKDLDTILTSIYFFKDHIFVGTTDGNVLIYNLELNLISSIQLHDDRVQDIIVKNIEGINYLFSCSKDGLIKICEFVDQTLTHKQTLVGHNDWIYQINVTENNSILSASADKSIMIWKLTPDRTWECETILGGASAFINAFYFKDCIIGQSYSGSFYKFDECISDFISGHTDSITSLDWNGNYLLSTSLDKTARIFHENREVGRPITHGYELSAGKFLNESSLSIVLGSQETIIRVLNPTYVFYLSCEWMKNNLQQIEELNSTNYFSNIEDCKIAAVPAELSLTNDVIEDYEFQNVNEYLLSTTTFVEIKKMYGHYFEVSDIAISDDFIASCNKSLTKKFGGVFLWNKNFDIVDYLEVHSFGIIKLRFSPNGSFLCSVSKDKTSCIYEVKDKLHFKYLNTDHKRVIWDCTFSYDSRYYATGSRDKKIFIYDLLNNKKIVSTFDLQSEVTALDFSPVEYLLVIGTEKGELHQIVLEGEKFVLKEDIVIAHSQRVNAIKFNKAGDLLASGGRDGLINTFKI